MDKEDVIYIHIYSTKIVNRWRRKRVKRKKRRRGGRRKKKGGKWLLTNSLINMEKPL